jgi:hypothetical protein
MPLKPIEKFTDEQLRAELQRRAELIVSSLPEAVINPADLSELAPGAWGSKTDKQTEDGSITSEWQGITRLAIARVRELLGIPLNPEDSSYPASLRGINSAVGNVLMLISKLNAEMLRPPQQDRLPELLELLKEEQIRLWERKLPGLLGELTEISDQELEELLAKRREHLGQRRDWRAELYRSHGFDPPRGSK